MFGLGFYPHLDIYHSTFRLLGLCGRERAIELDAYRILDYFALFPFELSIIRARGSAHKRIAKSYEFLRPYRWTAEPVATFLQMRPYQDAAVRGLVSAGLVDRNELLGGRVRLAEKIVMSSELWAAAEAFIHERETALVFLEELLAERGLHGSGGLKDRTGLMPYKSDVRPDVTIS